MQLEEEIFKNSYADVKKLEEHGFEVKNDIYVYSKIFKNGDFRAEITIDKMNMVLGKLYDLSTGDEYSNIRVKSNEGAFVRSIRQAYKEILIDIKKKCFNTNFFTTGQANRITTYIIQTYGDEPEFLWKKSPGSAVFRNKENHKWYGIIMNVARSKITTGTGEIEIINLKANELTIQALVKQQGFYRGYHMNKKNWFTIILDDTIADEEIRRLIEMSYQLIN